MNLRTVPLKYLSIYFAIDAPKIFPYRSPQGICWGDRTEFQHLTWALVVRNAAVNTDKSKYLDWLDQRGQSGRSHSESNGKLSRL